MALSDLDIHGMRGDEALLRRELEAAGVRFKGRSCKCPFHEDRSPSASIHLKDGAWHFHCFVCDLHLDIFDVRAKLNKTDVGRELTEEAMRRGPAKPPEPPTKTWASLEEVIDGFRNVDTVYRYVNPTTNKPDLAVIRWMKDGKKCFTQCSPTLGGRWWMKKPEGKCPLYNRGRVAATQMVVVVEGEKCVHALHTVGVVATTSPGGAMAGNKADWTPLAGKHVILWQDNDQPGSDYIAAVKRELMALSPLPSLALVQHEGLELGEGGDAADFIARYGHDLAIAKSAVEDVLADAKAIGVYGDYVLETDKIISGQRRAIPFVYPGLTRESRALMPGTVTCLFGPPGTAKSLLMMENIVEWVIAGVKVCVYELEDDRNYHLRRAHAQVANNSKIADNEWTENNGELFKQSRAQHAEVLTDIGACIWDAPDEEVSFEMVEVWVEERAKAGFEIIVIDPVTAIQTKDKPWIADQKFIFKVKTLARRYNMRIILVTHPRKSNKPGQVGLDDMAGGASYTRFSHTVLIIEWNDKKEEVTIREGPAHPTRLATPDRLLRIAKARNGPGAGARLAMMFQPDTLRFKELGTIEKALTDAERAVL